MAGQGVLNADLQLTAIGLGDTLGKATIWREKNTDLCISEEIFKKERN